MNSDSTGRHGHFLAYWQLTKPRLWIMLTYTAGIGFLASLKVHGASWVSGLVIVTAVALGTSGANVVTCFIDRDIDSIMERTKKRPLPSGQVAPPSKALTLGLVLIASSLALLLLFSMFASAAIGIFGMVDNIAVYSAWLKRKSPLNIILGGFSGGAPVVAGWAANSNPISPVPLLMAAVVVLWIPSHIWSLALRWRDDYGKAGVPMLTVVIHPKNAIRCVASTSVLMFVFSLLLFVYGPFGWIYLGIAVVAGSVLLMLTLRMIMAPDGEAPFVLFKYTSPYLALILAAMVV